MSCHRAFDQAFLCDAAGSGWVNGAYKKYKSKVILDKEMARLSSSQPAAKRVLDIIEKDKELLEIKREIRMVEYRYREVQFEKRMVQDKYRTAQYEKRRLSVIGAIPIVRKQFLHKCGVADCLGSLSTAWKCEMCDTYSCSKCHAIKGENRDAEHTCDPANVASVDEIKKSTRNCPSCATAIYKIEGCDQMFCTMPGCETAFSFLTGQRETGRVHNPHFFEMQRQGLIAGDGTARAPGDRLCGGGPTQDLVRRLVIHIGASTYSPEELLAHDDPEMRKRTHVETFRQPWAHGLLEHIFRGSLHFNDLIVDRLRTRVTTAMDNEDLRVSLLLKRIDEKKFMSALMRRDKKRNQDQALLHIMELFSTVLQEQLRRVTRGATVMRRGVPGAAPRRGLALPTVFTGVSPEEIKSDIQSAQQEVERVRIYCNEQLQKIGANFKVTPKYIPENPCKLLRI